MIKVELTGEFIYLKKDHSQTDTLNGIKYAKPQPETDA